MSHLDSGHQCGRLRLHNELQRAFARSLIHADWPAPAGVYALTTTRTGPEPSQRSAYGFNVGTRCGDDPAVVARNRQFLHDTLALPSEPVWLHQVHGARVVTLPVPHAAPGALDADAGWEADAEPEADAVVTRTPGTVLAIQTADCLPVLFCAADGSELAAAHAGWRGLAGGVLEATLDTMRAPRKTMLAWLGPAIGMASYEVGDEVREAFIHRDIATMAGFTRSTRASHWLCDLYTLARIRLRIAGVTRIYGGDFDTFIDPRLHSYRRDGAASGRMVSLVWALPTAG